MCHKASPCKVETRTYVETISGRLQGSKDKGPMMKQQDIKCGKCIPFLSIEKVNLQANVMLNT